jgi:hypothetical protein
MTSTSEAFTQGTNTASQSLRNFFPNDSEGRAEAIGTADELCRQTGEIIFVTGTSEVPMDKGIAVSCHMTYPCLIHTATPDQPAKSMSCSSKENPALTLPFMTTVGGHVLFHVADTGAVLPAGWTGLCVDASDVNVFWYIGDDNGEQSFTRILAKELSSKILAGLYPIKGSMPKEVVELLYFMREKEVARLASQAIVTVCDLEQLDRGARFSVASTLFDRCNEEAKYALLHDEHPHVRSAATISNDKAKQTSQ